MRKTKEISSRAFQSRIAEVPNYVSVMEKVLGSWW